MRAFSLRGAVVLALAVPLGACHSILGLNFATRAAPAEQQAPPVAIAAVKPIDAKTAEGRAHLVNGQPGLAIPAFLEALDKGEATAPAVNGLGVAYARIGRFDLARRFFQEAAVLEPLEARYKANLAQLTRAEDASRALALAAQAPIERARPMAVAGRLQRVSSGAVTLATLAPSPSPSVLPRVAFKVATLAAKAPEPAPPIGAKPAVAPAAARKTVTVSAPAVVRVSSPALLQRSARGDIRIATAPAGPMAPRPALAQAGRTFHPLVRIALADVDVREPRGVIRIALPDPKPVRVSELASAVARRSGAVRN